MKVRTPSPYSEIGRSVSPASLRSSNRGKALAAVVPTFTHTSVCCATAFRSPGPALAIAAAHLAERRPAFLHSRSGSNCQVRFPAPAERKRPFSARHGAPTCRRSLTACICSYFLREVLRSAAPGGSWRTRTRCPARGSSQEACVCCEPPGRGRARLFGRTKVALAFAARAELSVQGDDSAKIALIFSCACWSLLVFERSAMAAAPWPRTGGTALHAHPAPWSRHPAGVPARVSVRDAAWSKPPNAPGMPGST